MAVVREFYFHDRMGEVESFALARDVVTDKVFILHGKGSKKPDLVYVESQISLKDFFLREDGSEQTALLNLIGTLVVENW